MNLACSLFQDGIVDPGDSTLRDFCGQCVHEFLKWSIKQTTPQQQEKSPVNTKSLFKRLYSLALHPNAFKRLGAALAFNNIYREFRWAVNKLIAESSNTVMYKYLCSFYQMYFKMLLKVVTCGILSSCKSDEDKHCHNLLWYWVQ